MPPGGLRQVPVSPRQSHHLVTPAHPVASYVPGIPRGTRHGTPEQELIPTNKNWLYSRSMLFNIIPLLHTGARANFKVNDMLSLQASVLNGWNDDPDLNAWKDVGLSAAITPNSMLTIAITEYLGKPLAQGPWPARPVTSARSRTSSWASTLSEKLGLNLNVDYIKGYNGIAADYQVGVAVMGRSSSTKPEHCGARRMGPHAHERCDGQRQQQPGPDGRDRAWWVCRLGRLRASGPSSASITPARAWSSNGKNDQVTGPWPRWRP